jgi:hypothetical protein
MSGERIKRQATRGEFNFGQRRHGVCTDEQTRRVLLHTRAKTNTLQQQGNQFSLAAHTRFRKDVSQVHTRRGAPNAQFLAAILQ